MRVKEGERNEKIVRLFLQQLLKDFTNLFFVRLFGPVFLMFWLGKWIIEQLIVLVNLIKHNFQLGIDQITFKLITHMLNRLENDLSELIETQTSKGFEALEEFITLLTVKSRIQIQHNAPQTVGRCCLIGPWMTDKIFHFPACV